MMKVECIVDFEPHRAGRRHGPLEIYPVKGQIYTIRKVRLVIEKFYLLNEISNPQLEYSDGVDELAFVSKAFRPVTDISALQKLTKVEELEEV